VLPAFFILQESPAWPVLVESCASRGIKLGLLNARMSSRAFLAWFQRRMSRALLQRMLTSFSLIVPQSDIVSVKTDIWDQLTAGRVGLVACWASDSDWSH
jgi:3-deoxy-D-manno-octulosonic-acid transferase